MAFRSRHAILLRCCAAADGLCSRPPRLRPPPYAIVSSDPALLRPASSSFLRRFPPAIAAHPSSPFPSQCHLLIRWRSFSTSVRIVRLSHDPGHDDDDEDPLSLYIRTSLRDDPDRRPGGRVSAGEGDSATFVVSFLGTGGRSTGSRISSATALRLGGQTYLFDAGEGVERQMTFARTGAGDVTRIFLTHLHGDHLYGLPGLILRVHEAAIKMMEGSGTWERGKGWMMDRPVLEVYGPPGLHTYLSMTLMLSCIRLRYLTVVVYELVGGGNDAGPAAAYASASAASDRSDGKRDRARGKNVFLARYPEANQPGLIRRTIPRSPDGLWRIEVPTAMTESDILASVEKVEQEGGRYVSPNDPSAGKSRVLCVRAAEVHHVPGVQTFGYAVEEPIPPRNINAAGAKELGVMPGPKYQLLRHGFAVARDDGTGTVEPEDVLEGQIRPRKFVLVGDNCGWSKEMEKLGMGADVLVHEATVPEDGGGEKHVVARGHSTAEMAGHIARQINARVLLLNHISKKTSNSFQGLNDLVQRCRKANGGASQVRVSYDFMEMWVPRGGFDFLKEGVGEKEGIAVLPDKIEL